VSLPDVKNLSTEDLDALLEAVSLERAKREPAVTMEQPRTMEAAMDPKWYVSLSGANTFLQLRHPGYGWVGYVIAPASRAALASFLLQHALLPAPKTDTPPPVVSGGGGTVH
jgi:hypothetical protein